MCTRGGCEIYAVVEDGIWKLPPDAAHLLEDNHLDDADALMTLARCLAHAETRASTPLREALDAELSKYTSAWLSEQASNEERANEDAAEE